HIFDRDAMIEKLFFDEYVPMTSFWQYGAYANPDNPPMPYDEFKAVELLEEAGWTEINGEGYRERDGKVLQFEVLYASAFSEPPLTKWQESAKRAGIKLDLKLLTPPALWKQLREKQYDICSVAWGALLFPNPSTAWGGQYAEKVDTNNVTSINDPQIDALIAKYDQERDQKKREAIIRQLDARAYELQPYVLAWYLPSQRVLVSNKLGFPEPWGTGRFGKRVGDNHITDYWWVDPDKAKAYDAAKADESLTMEKRKIDWRFWEQWSVAQLAKADAPAEPAVPAAEDAE
ncbi:MAG: ABC transporter substrate-binding protein, partial [Myxococcota bacterium]